MSNEPETFNSVAGEAKGATVGDFAGSAPAVSGAVPRAASAGAGPAPTAARVRTFHSLRFRNYRLLWIGTLLSGAGQWIQQATLNWLVYDMTGSGSILGIANAARAFPALLFGPIGGVAADRLHRKHLMQVTNLFLVLTSFGLGVGLALDRVNIWHLLLFTALNGIVWPLNQPVRQTVVFDMVPRHAVANAVALNASAFNFARTFGPMAAGMLIAWIGPSGNFFLQSAMYTGIGITIALMVVPPRGSQPKKQHPLTDLSEGMRYVWHDRTIRALLAFGLVPVLLAMPYMALLPVFAKDVYHGGPRTLGFLMASGGLGGLTGALFSASLGSFQRRGLLQLGAISLFGLSLLGLALSPHIGTAMLSVAVAGFSQMIFMTTNQTLLLTRASGEMRGRVTSIQMMEMGFAPLGTVGAGIATDIWSAPQAVAVMGVACLAVAAAVFLWVPRIRNIRLSGPVGARVGGEG